VLTWLEMNGKFTWLKLSLAKENLNQWKFDKTHGDQSNELE